MRNLSVLSVIWYHDMLHFLGDRMRSIAILTLAGAYLVIFGYGVGQITSGGISGTDISYLTFIFPGIIGVAVVMYAVMSGMNISFDREAGFLKQALVAPISSSAAAMGKGLGGATSATLLGIVMLVFTPLTSITLSVTGVLLAIALMFLLGFNATALVVVFVSLPQRLRFFQGVLMGLAYALVFISPALFPLGNLPSWLSILVKLNPISYGIDAIRQALLGGVVPAALGIQLFGYHMTIALDVAVLVFSGVVLGVLAAKTFRPAS